MRHGNSCCKHRGDVAALVRRGPRRLSEASRDDPGVSASADCAASRCDHTGTAERSAGTEPGGPDEARARAGGARRPATTQASAPAPTAPPPAATTPAQPSAPPAPSMAAPTRPAPAPAPAAAPTTTARPSPKEFTAIADLKDIHFAFDKYDIRPGDAKVLDANAAWLKSHGDYLVLVEGHCDERGTNEYNLEIGRASC